MATEVTFAKTFLSLLDSKPPKISSDHVEDPRSYPGSIPYTIPKHPSCKPFSKLSSSARSSATSAGAGAAAATTGPILTVILRSPRNPAFDLTLPAQAPSTSLAEIKERVVQETGIEFGRIKLLLNKKPVADSKALKDLLPGAGVEGNEAGAAAAVELGVMVLGGASVTLKKKDEPAGNGQGQGQEARAGTTSASASVAQGLSGTGVLETGQFWDDLKGFLQQRVRDEGVAGEALRVFQAAWEGRS
ncbi:cell-cycle control medial ring component [Chaetomium strumarium]|uniref:Cell-cycle control medial ring component n=1 Tax=Chaetomium strumarium TaxID=1170767 RepID=A0AAJ0GQQ8_9PEZI|nr:cell-cycle control medial ring component [Chaetomium strumarium]